MNKKKLEKVKAIEVDILNYVVDVCNSNKIRYYLAYGTLLGAVRHGGFIPWDDDIDVVVPREDYDRLCKLLEFKCNHDKSAYYFQNSDIDMNFRKPYSKVRRRGTIFLEEDTAEANGEQGIYIDIFPLDTVKHKRGLQKIFSFFVFRLLKYRRKKKGFFSSMVYIMSTWYKQGDYYVVYGSPYKVEKDIYRKEWFEKSALIKFEGNNYNIPKYSDLCLKQIYGDYMTLPPEEKRVCHNPKRIEFGDL